MSEQHSDSSNPFKPTEPTPTSALALPEPALHEHGPMWPWAICFVLLVATLLNYMDRQALAVTLPTLKTELNLNESRIGTIEKYFSYSFALGGLLFGWLADRYGPRILYPAVLTGWSVAGIATSMAGQEWVTKLLEKPGDEPGTGVYHWLLICRIVLGLCEAGHWPCALLTVRAVLVAKQRTLGNGILQSGASIGAIIVPLYVEAAERAGQTWEFSFWSIGVAGLFWVPLWFMLIGRQPLRLPRTDPGSDSSHSAEAALKASEPRSVLIRKLITLVIIVTTLTISWQFLRAWLALFLQDFHGYSKLATRGAMSGYFIASDVGCFFSGVLVAQLAARGWTVHGARVFGFFLFVLLTGCGALVPFVGSGKLMIFLLYVAGAGILGLHPFYYSLIQELSTKHMGTFSGALAAVGWVITGSFQAHLGTYIQEQKSYDLGLLMVGLAPVAGFVALALLWPRKKGD